MLPAPTTVIEEPRACPRSLAGKAVTAMAMPVPWVMLPPTPCRILNTIRTLMLWAVLARTPPTMNIRNPMMYTRLRPIMSERRPMGRSSTLIVSE